MSRECGEEEKCRSLSLNEDRVTSRVGTLGQGLTRQAWVGAHLPELGHSLTGDNLIVLQPGDKAESLELILPLLQLPQDQGSEDLHILKGKRETMEPSWREGPQTSPGEVRPGHCPSAFPKDTAFSRPRKWLIFSIYTRDFKDHTSNVSTAFWKIDK